MTTITSSRLRVLLATRMAALSARAFDGGLTSRSTGSILGPRKAKHAKDWLLQSAEWAHPSTGEGIPGTYPVCLGLRAAALESGNARSQSLVSPSLAREFRIRARQILPPARLSARFSHAGFRRRRSL